MTNSEPRDNSPVLPIIARKPLALVPNSLKVKAISDSMNRIFALPLQTGELEFLDQRTINIIVSDAAISFSLRLVDDHLQAGIEAPEADLTIEGSVYTFLLLATRKADSDTLFFQRQLKTSGDTELGLYVKNFLDGLEPESLPHYRTVDRVLNGSLAIADGVEELRDRLSNFWLRNQGKDGGRRE